MTFEDLPSWLSVSRETFDKLQSLKSLIEKWNPAINLVAKSQIGEMWSRHILDSAQLFEFCPPSADSWCDLGSGGGFPGLIIAIMAAELSPDLKVTLVESDQRKAAFLRQASRELGLEVNLKNERIEFLVPQNSSVVSARALAPLSELLHLVSRHLNASGIGVFPKGIAAEQEISAARTYWNFELTERTSKLSSDAKILILRDISHV